MSNLASKLTAAIPITLLPTKYVPAPDAAAFGERTADAAAGDLVGALGTTFATDAHFTAYAPFMATDESDRPFALRLSYGVIGQDGCETAITALVGDFDGPSHKASAGWRAEQRPKLEASGLAYYETRGGFRVLAALEVPFPITMPADSERWKARYLAWCDAMAEQGITLDRQCCDWTRCYRLPNVTREKVGKQRAELRGTLTRVALPEATAAPAGTTRARTAAGTASDAATAMAAQLPPSIAGHGGDAALFHAARELATLLGPDASAIRAALDIFNARCLPPWDGKKLDREATRAADAQSTVAAKTLRRLRGESATERTIEAPANDGGVPLFLVAQASDEKWHLDPCALDYVPFVKQSLHASLRETGLAELVPNLRGPRGALMPAQSLIDEGPTATVHAVEIDFARSGRAMWDPPNRRVLVGVRPKEIA